MNLHKQGFEQVAIPFEHISHPPLPAFPKQTKTTDPTQLDGDLAIRSKPVDGGRSHTMAIEEGCNGLSPRPTKSARTARNR
jgi:hypothetical protein